MTSFAGRADMAIGRVLEMPMAAGEAGVTKRRPLAADLDPSVRIEKGDLVDADEADQARERAQLRRGSPSPSLRRFGT